MVEGDAILNSALRLHHFIVDSHLGDGAPDGALIGPDQGVRWNRVAWRLLRSYLPFIPQADHFIFYQGLGYWVRANLKLAKVTGDSTFTEHANNACDFICETQMKSGAWPYPLRERRGLIATLEGLWASYACALMYNESGNSEYADVVTRWYEFMVDKIGFQEYDGTLCINYFDKPRGLIPNNAIESIWILSETAELLRDDKFTEYVPGQIEFIAKVQSSAGEIPYIVDGPKESGREHFLCFNYNAFQFVGLARFYQVTKNEKVIDILKNLARFLVTGVSESGTTYHQCGKATPHTFYYDAIMAEAFAIADNLFPDTGYGELSTRLVVRLLKEQRDDGSFPFSNKEYGFLKDGRSYPRNQAMILSNLIELSAHKKAKL